VRQGLRIEGRQHQALTPRLQQAVRLLQLSSLEFAQEIQQALGNNPFLESEETEETAVRKDAPEDKVMDALTAMESGPAATAVAEAETAEASPPADSNAWGETWSRNGSSRGDSDMEASDFTAANVSLREHLRQQLSLLSLNFRDQMICRTLIEAMDDDGYLRVDFADLAALLKLEPMSEVTEWEVGLKLVQSLEPRGVGARDVRECLLLQVTEPDSEIDRVAAKLIEDHLPLLAARDFAGIARRMGIESATVDAACERIRRLNPRPGWGVGGSEVRFLTPDVMVKKVRDHWVVQLNESIVPRIRLHRMYADLFQSHRNGESGDMARQLQEARWMVRNVEQRFSTIVRVANEIVAQQRNFFEYGELAMKPLGLREVAEKLGLHESTVSRVTNNKYMSTPQGVLELKFFFSRAMPTATGGSCSATAIRSVIRELIQAETPRAPLSDAEIARLLKRQGLQVARRTVTKYRQTMRVPAVEIRRQRANAAAAM